MRATLLFAALLVAPAAAVLAQAPVTHTAPEHRHHATPHRAAMHLQKRLGLSSDQEARLEPILADRQQKSAAIRANTQLSDTERHQQLKAVRHESQAAMNGVLSPSQMQQMHAMRHARHTATTPTGV